MNNINYKYLIIGIAVFLLPFIALGYKYGIESALLILIFVSITIIFAKITIYLFTRKNKLAKGGAIANQCALRVG